MFGCMFSSLANLSYDKKKAAIFDGPQIRSVVQNFVTAMTADIKMTFVQNS